MKDRLATSQKTWHGIDEALTAKWKNNSSLDSKLVTLDTISYSVGLFSCLQELLKKCHQCMEILVSAKDRQAAQANKNASILLEELDLEKSREESKKAALARKREKRRRKKKEKQEKEQRERDEKVKEEEKTGPENR